MSDKAEKIISEALKRFAAAEDATSEDRRLMKEDLEFSDPTNPQQWPDAVKRQRESAVDGARPCLTFDRTNQFVQQVINDARQNKPAIKLIPADSDADPKLAGVLQGLVRQIEYQSKASVAYDTALEFAARIGLGYIRVFPEVEDDATNAQRIRIKRVVDPLSVRFDPDSTEPDGSDARWAIVYEDVPNDEFDRLYPKADRKSWNVSGDWIQKDCVRVAEYFRVVEGAEKRCEWYKLTAEEILDQSVFPSEYVGIVPCIGSEIWRDGKRHLAGLVRRAKDPQRSYNYERSSFIERVALAPKAPFVAAIESIQGHETEWSQANTANKAFLPFNARDDEGEPLPMPTRQQPAPMEAGWLSAAQQSINDMQAAFGMFEANLGAPSNEKSGKAILARQREGDTATYHYIDNLSLSIAQVGRIILQMIPRLYDAQRIVRILGEDDATEFVEVNPLLEVGYQEQPAPNGQKRIVINPSVGKYDVMVTMGPAYTTRRQESAEAIAQLVNGNPQLMAILGDEWVRMMDWPNADKLSERLKALLPPELRQAEEGDDPQIAMLQQQAQAIQEQAAQAIQEMQAQLQQLQAELETTKADKAAQSQKVSVDAFKAKVEAHKAETERLQLLATMPPDVQTRTLKLASIDPGPIGPSEDDVVSALQALAGNFQAQLQAERQQHAQAMAALQEQIAMLQQKGGRQFDFVYDADGNVISAVETPQTIQ